MAIAALIISLIALVMTGFWVTIGMKIAKRLELFPLLQSPPMTQPVRPEPPPAKLVDHDKLELTAPQIAMLQAGKVIKDETGGSWEML